MFYALDLEIPEFMWTGEEKLAVSSENI